MKYEIDGEIKLVKEAQSFGANGFKKREFVITVPDGKYPQDIALECHGERCELLDALSDGDQITAHFNIRGREYNGRYFNNLVCWKIESAASPSQRRADESHDGPPLPDDSQCPADDGDDVPF